MVIKHLLQTHRHTAPSDLGWGGGGGGHLIARKKLQNARKRQLYIRTEIAVKTKLFPIFTSNETVIILETQIKIAFKNRTVREITAFD